MRNVYKILVAKPERKRTLGRPMCRWEDIIKSDLKGGGFEGVNWIHVAQDIFQWWVIVCTVMVFRFFKRQGIY
jgi:hypothetical protein